MNERYALFMTKYQLLLRRLCKDVQSRVINLVHLPQLPILNQLLLEETIFRAPLIEKHVGWVFYNDYTKTKSLNTISPFTIVLGRSQNPREMVFEDIVLKDSVPLIRRYSGGGTVLLSPSTFLVSFLLPHCFFESSYPLAALKWSGNLYSKVFGTSFVLRENDYTVKGLQKFGGNAQAFSRSLVSHHTSFLWESDVLPMKKYLQLPKKQPSYRLNRDHENFVCGIKDTFHNQFNTTLDIFKSITMALKQDCKEKKFVLKEIAWEDVRNDLQECSEFFLKCESKLQIVNQIDINGKGLLNFQNYSFESV